MRKLVQVLAGVLGLLVGFLLVWVGVTLLIALIDLTRGAGQGFPRSIVMIIVPASFFGPALGLIGGVHLATRLLSPEDRADDGGF